MDVIFMGTPIFGRVVLEALSRHHNVVAVVCPPDKPNRRGNKIEYCEVKKYAIERGLRVLQYDKVNNAVDELRALGADMIVTASFGQIISKELLEMCPLGTLNVHGSLLPRLRGASPVPEAIRLGYKETGVTIMRMSERMDEGDMILKVTQPIHATQTADELMYSLAKVGADALIEAMRLVEAGEAVYEAQDDAEATYCAKIKKEDAKIDFAKGSTEVRCQINAMSSLGAYFEYEGNVYKILRADSADEYSGQVGEVLEATPRGGFVVACGSGAVRALEMQASGGKVLSAKDFLNGKKFVKGSILG